MQLDFPLARLGDHVDACLGKMLDVNKNKGEFQPYLGNSNVRWGSFDLTDLSKMRFEPHEDGRYGILPGDLIVCEGGEPGRCAVWEGKVSTMKIQKALHRIRVKPTLNNYYLYYWFCHAGRSGLLEPYFTGTTIKHLTGKAIAELKVPLPDVRVQDAMVDVLRRMDECIESLRETNTTLEAIAQAIFKSWFIDFDPVKAKSEGRTPDGIDADTAALFPDSFEESALGAIPKGWTATPLRDVLTPIAERVGDSVVPEYASTNDGLVPREKLFNKQLSKSQANNKVIRRGDLVFGLSRATLNYGQMTDEIGSVSSAYKVFRVDSGKVVPVLLGRLISTRKEYFFNAVSASSREGQSVSTSSLERLQFACPPLSLQRALHSTLEPFLELIDCNLQEMATLAELRDTLLPRLISGKLKLPELQEVAEAV